jgi:arylformamidase
MTAVGDTRFDPALDSAYDARGSVASFDDEYAALVRLSEAARREIEVQADLVFDEVSGMALDLYGAAPGRPVMLWIHGGYWRAGNKADNGFAAPGLVGNGIAVAVMDYALAPDASLFEIVRQVRQAMVWLAGNGHSFGLDTGKVHVGGSSAGGHLASMTLPTGWHSGAGIGADRIGAVLALSGLFDLAPLRRTRVNEWLRLNAEEAHALSPINNTSVRHGAPILLSVGGRESEAFQRQTSDFEAALVGAGNRVRSIPMRDFNHFDITATLADPGGPLTRAMVDAIREIRP